MLLEDDLCWTEELTVDEPAELLRTMPEIRQSLDPEPADEAIGLRSILEHPDALSRAWRRQAFTARRGRNDVNVLSAA